MSNAIALADQQCLKGDVAGGLATLKAAAADGDALAARELAVWYLQGQPVARNLAESRLAFARAAELGDEPSQRVYRNFVAQGLGGPADWAQAIALLHVAADGDDDARRQLPLLNGLAASDEAAGKSISEAATVSEEPLIRTFEGIVSPAECDFLVDSARPLLQPAVIVDPVTGRQTANPIRTSEAAAFAFVDESPIIHAINRRIALASGTDVRCGEPLQVLRYSPGQEYRLHSDALPGCPPAQQRVLTFLIWLNDDYQGGETSFPKLGIQLRGRKGDGLLFGSTQPDGQPDPRANHAGLPVTAGGKLLASRWIRATPLIY